MSYTAVFERDPDGRWTVDVPEVQGCHSYGRTIEQARERVREALALFVDDADTADFRDDVRIHQLEKRPARRRATKRAAKKR